MLRRFELQLLLLTSSAPLPACHVMSAAIRTGRLRIQALLRRHQLLGAQATSPGVACALQSSNLLSRFDAVSRQCCYIHWTLSTVTKGVKGKGTPPHDGSCGHPLSSSLGLVILELVRLVNDLFGDDLLDDICACLHRSTFISVPSMTYLRGL